MKQNEAINKLKENSSIIIKEADKGAAVVIMDTEYYKEKVHELILDENTYEKLEEDMDKQVMKRIFLLMSKYSSELTENEIKYITKFEYKGSNFYGLPKVHKSNLINCAIEIQKSEVICVHKPHDLKLRPIIAGPACPTHRLSHFIDIILQPMVSNVQSYVRDDMDILTKLPKRVGEGSRVATFDVEALYSNIHHALGLEAIRYWLEKIPNKHSRISNQFILSALSLILECNTFKFDGNHFRQLVGTAMGTKCAPAYATLTLGFLESKLYHSIGKHYPEDVSTFFKENYFRYLDDVLIIFDDNKIPLYDIDSELNNLNTSLKFKCESSGHTVNFLDIKIYIKDDSTIETDIFYKPTDTHQYLNFYSNHPRHTKIAVPYNLSRRICMIVSCEELRDQRLKEMGQFLYQCKYPINLINDSINKATAIDRSTLLNHNCNKITQDNNHNKIIHVSTYNPNFDTNEEYMNNIFCYLKKNAEDVFSDNEILSSKRQPANIKQILTRANFNTNPIDIGVFKCNKSRCKLCEIIKTGDVLYFKNVNFQFKIKSYMTCDTLNCIYVIICAGCKDIYIGETNNFRLRTNLHRDHALKNTGLGVSRHIFKCTINMENKFTIMPFYKLNSDDIQFRKSMETHFINKFQPELNRL